MVVLKLLWGADAGLVAVAPRALLQLYSAALRAGKVALEGATSSVLQFSSGVSTLEEPAQITGGILRMSGGTFSSPASQLKLQSLEVLGGRMVVRSSGSTAGDVRPTIANQLAMRGYSGILDLQTSVTIPSVSHQQGNINLLTSGMVFSTPIRYVCGSRRAFAATRRPS
jgi:hypothetical protein